MTQVAEQEWQFGPVRVWLRPHQAGMRGEPQARVVICGVLGLPAEQLAFIRDQRGRPRLQPPLQHLDAGWSHSGDQLLIGLGERMLLGVDLELRRRRPRMREVAQRFFHPQEITWLAGLDDEHYEHWFFRLWCAKEALLKAYGHGLSFGLHRLCWVPREGALALAWCDPALGNADAWRLHEWQPAVDYHAALAWYPQAAG
jgi:4'-phosphopantetheinyl transferase